jgi:uncharacterized protein (DUF2164 family)
MKRKEHLIPLTKEQKTTAAAKIKEYIAENLDTEIGGLQAEFFVDFITENIGGFYYNRAVADSMAFITDKTEDMYLLMKDEE